MDLAVLTSGATAQAHSESTTTALAIHVNSDQRSLGLSDFPQKAIDTPHASQVTPYPPLIGKIISGVQKW
jgi:hypothetical protein